MTLNVSKSIALSPVGSTGNGKTTQSTAGEKRTSVPRQEESTKTEEGKRYVVSYENIDCSRFKRFKRCTFR